MNFDRLKSFFAPLAGRKFGKLETVLRDSNALGPWTSTIGGWVPMTVNPWLYEALRRALPPLDGGIERLVTIDGVIDVEGGSDKLASEIREWMENVQVNDAQRGLQAVYAGMGNEMYEQGFGVAEYTADLAARDITQIRLADSKGVRFLRGDAGLEYWYSPPSAPPCGRMDGTDDVERILRGNVATAGQRSAILQAAGYVQLNPASLIYTVRMPEADNPYGTSIMRSLEFVSQIILKIQNATGRVWERFGDPSFSVLYKTANKKVTPAQLEERKALLASNLAAALSGKSKGNSLDFVNAVGADDDIKIDIIGANGTALEIEMPARHMLEQILAKLGLAAWMLGFTWNTSDRSGDAQAEMILSEAKTRWVSRKPHLRHLVETMLRLRGRSWKPGDWDLVQRTPNLRDELKTAQAAFLRAQTLMMLNGQADPGHGSPAEPGTDPLGGGQPKLWTPDSETRAKMLRAIEEARSLEDLARVIAQFENAPAL
jgi:hypothetical protein